MNATEKFDFIMANVMPKLNNGAALVDFCKTNPKVNVTRQTKMLNDTSIMDTINCLFNGINFCEIRVSDGIIFSGQLRTTLLSGDELEAIKNLVSNPEAWEKQLDHIIETLKI